MKTGIQSRAKLNRHGWRMAMACGLCVLAFVQPAQALVVTIDLGWGYGAGWTAGNADANLRDTYHLQPGSIVQVIMYNSGDYPSTAYQGQSPVDNFRDPLGTFGGSLSSAPFDTGHEPSSSSTFNPMGTPVGHEIAYTTQIGDAISDPNGYWFNVYAQFQILGTYDRLYVRVFGQTDFENPTLWASYWGLSPVQTNSSFGDTWFVPVIDDFVAAQSNYFHVIPEPGTMTMLGLGGLALLTGWRRRSKSPG
jgi:MYXO-CTERM domain-containing protein